MSLSSNSLNLKATGILKMIHFAHIAHHFRPGLHSTSISLYEGKRRKEALIFPQGTPNLEPTFWRAGSVSSGDYKNTSSPLPCNQPGKQP
jgi:hypothetical protein